MRAPLAMAAAGLLLTACEPRGRAAVPASEAPPRAAGSAADSGPTRSPRSYAFSDNWAGGLGCEAKGEVLSLTGTVRVRPFGKGTDGAVLETPGGEWVLSYRAEGALLLLRDRRVQARGRECAKRGEAVAGRHLDLQAVVEPAD